MTELVAAVAVALSAGVTLTALWAGWNRDPDTAHATRWWPRRCRWFGHRTLPVPVRQVPGAGDVVRYQFLCRRPSCPAALLEDPDGAAAAALHVIDRQRLHLDAARNQLDRGNPTRARDHLDIIIRMLP